MFFFGQVPKSQFTPAAVQHQRAELGKEIRVPEQHGVGAVLSQLPQSGFAIGLINARPKLAFPAENIFD